MHGAFALTPECRGAGRAGVGGAVRYVDSLSGEPETSTLLSWLGQEMPTASSLTLRSGFFSAPGIQLMRDPLEQMLIRGGNLLVVLGGDALQCDIQALQTLLDLCRTFPDQARAYIVTEPAFQNAKTYHLHHRDGHRSAWVGSANFTMGGFATNFEAAIVLDTSHDDPQVVDQVRDATLVAVDQPTATALNQTLIGHLAGRLQRSTWDDGHRRIRPASRVVQEHGPALMERLECQAAGGADTRVLSTGLPALDDVLHGGLRPGTLTVIGGRPSAGTSTLALNMLTRAALQDGVPSCLYSYETSSEDIALQTLSATTGIPLRSLQTGQLTDHQWLSLGDTLDSTGDAPLYIDSGTPMHLDALAASIALTATRDRVELVGVDPASAVLVATASGRREHDINEVLHRLKALAMQLRIRIVTTAELGRLADDAEWQPALTDLRDTEAVASAADVVILLHRPDRYQRDHPRAGEATLIVAKNRYGFPATIPIAHQLHIARFAGLAPPGHEPRRL